MIEKIIMGIALWFCGYSIGYMVGFDRCFRFLKVKVEEARKEAEDGKM